MGDSNFGVGDGGGGEGGGIGDSNFGVGDGGGGEGGGMGDSRTLPASWELEARKTGSHCGSRLQSMGWPTSAGLLAAQGFVFGMKVLQKMATTKPSGMPMAPCPAWWMRNPGRAMREGV